MLNYIRAYTCTLIPQDLIIGAACAKSWLPEGDEIQIWKIRELIYKYRELGVNVRWVSFDGFQSTDSLQTLRQKGFQTGLMSVDRTDIPYQLTKMELYAVFSHQLTVSRAVQYLKGKSSHRLLSEYKALRMRYWGQHLWARGYWVASSGNVTDEVWKEYIKNQQPPEPDEDFTVV